MSQNCSSTVKCKNGQILSQIGHIVLEQSKYIFLIILLDLFKNYFLNILWTIQEYSSLYYY